ncbi:hypothetical protein MNBD_GAMMA23-1761 [hydrothermal vent metagenome]|uniref:Thioredoxin domain-containing protein n=1 Tax=hydrothermal vent metagenome TaxID=652676 RepID=A0A3B0ZXA3_9ZZZZ
MPENKQTTPQPDSTSASQVPSAAQIKKNKITMLVLFSMFVAPILFAVYIFNTNSSDNYVTKNRGNLINPAIELKNIELTYFENNKRYKLADQEHQWLMVFIGAGECGGSCKRQLVVMRQTRLAQGGEFTRVNRLYVMLDKQSDQFMKEVKAYHPDMDIVTGSEQQLANVTEQFKLADKIKPGNSNRIYIVDPIGNLMMYYELDAKAADIAKDLARLLKVSQMG